MPRYEYRCDQGHVTERMRPMSESHLPTDCPTCGLSAGRIMSRPAGSPDGIYSYMPNIGSADAFERRREAIKSGQKVIPKIQD